MSDWYWLRDGNTIGPCTSRQLKRAAEEGLISPETLVWKPKLNDWIEASAVRGLFGDQEPIPIAKPAPAQEAIKNPGSDGPAVALKAFESARGHVVSIVREFKAIDYQSEVLPVDQSSLPRILSDWVFWTLLAFGVVPLLIGTLQKPSHQLTLFALFFAMMWGVIFKSFVFRLPGKWGFALGSLFFTGLIGLTILSWIYRHVLPVGYLKLAESESAFTSLLGFIFQVGLCEELCKLLPVLAYLAWKRKSAEPLTAMMVGVFSGLGFAAFENMLYGDLSVLSSVQMTRTHGIRGLATGVQVSMAVAMLRSLSLVFSHAVLAGIVAYFAAIAMRTGAKAGPMIVLGVGIAALLHGTYDWLIGIQPTFAAFIVAVEFLLFYGYVSRLHAIELTAAGLRSDESSPNGIALDNAPAVSAGMPELIVQATTEEKSAV